MLPAAESLMLNFWFFIEVLLQQENVQSVALTSDHGKGSTTCFAHPPPHTLRVLPRCSLTTGSNRCSSHPLILTLTCWFLSDDQLTCHYRSSGQRFRPPSQTSHTCCWCEVHLQCKKGVNSFWESREIIVSQQNIDYLLKEICSLKTAPYFPLPRVLVGDLLHEEDSAVIPAQFVTCLH